VRWHLQKNVQNGKIFRYWNFQKRLPDVGLVEQRARQYYTDIWWFGLPAPLVFIFPVFTPDCLIVMFLQA
jgi:hypothetical protein